MKVYLEIFGGDEIISDSFEIKEVFNGAGGEVKSRFVTKGAVDVDIGKFLLYFSFLILEFQRKRKSIRRWRP